MAEGLAKSAVSVEATKPIVHPASPLSTMTSGEVAYMGVPIDMYAFFNLDLSKASEKQRERMGYIYSKLDGETLGERLLSLKQIEYKLGRAGFDSMLDKVNRYLRMGDEVKDLELRRKSMER
jgi:hypothetical protein